MKNSNKKNPSHPLVAAPVPIGKQQVSVAGGGAKVAEMENNSDGYSQQNQPIQGYYYSNSSGNSAIAGGDVSSYALADSSNTSYYPTNTEQVIILLFLH